jgi:hypothetical protein
MTFSQSGGIKIRALVPDLHFGQNWAKDETPEPQFSAIFGSLIPPSGLEPLVKIFLGA